MRVYLYTWIALTVLTLANFTMSYVHIGALQIVAELAIASVKTSLVVLFFMHMRYETGSIPLTVGVCMGLLLLLMGLTIADVQTRFRPSRPEGGPESDFAATTKNPIFYPPYRQRGTQ